MTPKQIQQEAERRYPLSKYWPKNREGNPIEMRVGQTGLPGSKKAKQEQAKFVAGATWAIQQLSSPDKTAEERAKELYPTVAEKQIVDMVYNLNQQEKQAAYLTGYKEALQQPVSPVEFAEWLNTEGWCPSEQKGKWVTVAPPACQTTAELYQQYLQTLK